MFGMARMLAAASLVLAPTLAGCVVGTVGGPRAVPEVTGMLAFAAYPKGRLISETGSTDNISFADRPGRFGSRVYETTDSRLTVRKYYETLGAANGWSVYAAGNDEVSFGTEFARLTRDRFTISVYADVAPGGAPEPSPSPGPDGQSPTQNGPFRFRIDASAY